MLSFLCRYSVPQCQALCWCLAWLRHLPNELKDIPCESPFFWNAVDTRLSAFRPKAKSLVYVSKILSRKASQQALGKAVFLSTLSQAAGQPRLPHCKQTELGI